MAADTNVDRLGMDMAGMPIPSHTIPSGATVTDTGMDLDMDSDIAPTIPVPITEIFITTGVLIDHQSV